MAETEQATPRPWHWNETTTGWGGQIATDEDGHTADKYLDLALYGPDNTGVINLWVDHYRPEWDQDPEEVKTADRQYLVTAVNAHDELVALVRELADGLTRMIKANPLYPTKGQKELLARADTLLGSLDRANDA